MTEVGHYDGDLGMFVQKAKPVNLRRLLFERWLIQNGKGEHFPTSRPAGEFALALVIKESLPVEDALRSVYRKARLEEESNTNGT